MPDPQELPSTMREITRHNGVKWIHDYQDACVDKIARFIGGKIKLNWKIFLLSIHTKYNIY